MDLRVRIGSGFFPNPVGVASGTFGYGSEYEELIDLSRIGALYTKAVTLEPRPGNDIPRIVETAAGMLNSIGLANVGSRGFIEKKLPFLSELSCPVVVNVAGDQEEDYAETLSYVEEHAELWGYEVNISCPNVKTGGLAIGTDAKAVEALTRRLRGLTRKPLIVKLTPNVTDIAEIARGAEAGGADAVSCINTLVGMTIDVGRKKTVLPAKTGGLSGPAVLPIGVAAVYRVSRAVDIPVIGLGGIYSGDDALQYFLAGAAAVQTGTANFVNPNITLEVLAAVEGLAEEEGLSRIEDFHSLLD
jgi:dihydroorotate dehydrogenase (NAD+) catalytic subunit